MVTKSQVGGRESKQGREAGISKIGWQAVAQCVYVCDSEYGCLLKRKFRVEFLKVVLVH